jgi:glycosyltransferase involved in cell wall biosynthesis
MFMPRRVLIAAPQPFFSDRGTPIAVAFLAEALVELGVELEVLTYPIGEDVEGLHIRRVANPFGVTRVPAGFSLSKIALDVSFLYTLRQRLLGGDYDLVHAYEEAAYFVAGLAKSRVPTMIYDMASSIADELGRGTALGAPLRWLEGRVLARSDMVVCSLGLGSVVRARAGRIPYREWRFPASPPQVSPEEVGRLRRNLGIPEEAQVVLYAGTFAPYQATELMLGAVPKVLAADPRAFFVFVGLAGEDERMRATGLIGGAASSPRVRLLPRVARQQLDAFTALAGLLLSSRRDVRNAPLKLFNALAAGKPLVANDVPAHRTILNEQLALLVPSTSDGFATGILRLLEDHELARRLAANSLTYAQRHLRWAHFVELVREVYLAATHHSGRLARGAAMSGGDREAEPNEPGSD